MTSTQTARLRRDAVRRSWLLRAEQRAEHGPRPRPGWHEQGACYGCRGGITVDLCEHDCTVRLDCLTAAIIEERHVPIEVRHGVRGGLPATARTTPMVHRRAKVAQCGTNAGYMAHHRLGEATCAPCRDAHALAARRTKVVA